MRRFVISIVLLVAMGAASHAQRPSTDWTQWRGPNRDGTIAAFTPPAAWPDTLVQRWKVEVGTGYATPIVVGDRVFQFSRVGENETMTAFDAASERAVSKAIVRALHGRRP